MSKEYELSILQRVIDAFLREDIQGITSKSIYFPLGSTLCDDLPYLTDKAEGCLFSSHFNVNICLPIIRDFPIQDYECADACWYTYENERWIKQNDYRAWIELMSTKLSEDKRLAYHNFIDEIQCAIEHKVLTQKVYEKNIASLSETLSNSPLDSLLLSDRLASFFDHPLYPTAKAKLGLTNSDITSYSPEFNQTFELVWCAVKSESVIGNEALPKFWPSLEDVGLAELRDQEYCLFPVHPIMKESLQLQHEGIFVAPKVYLKVRPTLSLRSMSIVTSKAFHIKVPVLMSTLGRSNLRTLSLQTLKGGKIMTDILSEVLSNDNYLASRMKHCDESSFGCIANNNKLSYMIRLYPEYEEGTDLISLASLFTLMNDGRFFVEHMITKHYEDDQWLWFDEFVELILSVHLRLWLIYGIGLEANQQNSVLCMCGKKMSLLFKDNDMPKIYSRRFYECAVIDTQSLHADLELKDKVLTDDEQRIGNLFITMVMHLVIVQVIKQLFRPKGLEKQAYRLVSRHVDALISKYKLAGIDIQLVEQMLKKEEFHPVKYLLTSASLTGNLESSGIDVNKFYGFSARNPLL